MLYLKLCYCEKIGIQKRFFEVFVFFQSSEFFEVDAHLGWDFGKVLF